MNLPNSRTRRTYTEAHQQRYRKGLTELNSPLVGFPLKTIGRKHANFFEKNKNAKNSFSGDYFAKKNLHMVTNVPSIAKNSDTKRTGTTNLFNVRMLWQNEIKGTIIHSHGIRRSTTDCTSIKIVAPTSNRLSGAGTARLEKLITIMPFHPRSGTTRPRAIALRAATYSTVLINNLGSQVVHPHKITNFTITCWRQAGSGKSLQSTGRLHPRLL